MGTTLADVKEGWLVLVGDGEGGSCRCVGMWGGRCLAVPHFGNPTSDLPVQVSDKFGEVGEPDGFIFMYDAVVDRVIEAGAVGVELGTVVLFHITG